MIQSDVCRERRVYECKYKELVTRPDIVLQGICEYMGFPYEAGMIEYHTHQHDAGIEDGGRHRDGAKGYCA
jgi:hypothetical protein